MLNMRSFANFLKRNSKDAQVEIRDIAAKMLELVQGSKETHLSLHLAHLS